MNPNVNPVYGYNCYNIANNQFLMWNKDLIKRDVETPQDENLISYVNANQNKEILWRNETGAQQVITYFNNEHNQKNQRINMVLSNIKNSSKYNAELREAASFLLSDKSIDLTCLFPYIEYFQSKTQDDKEIFFFTVTGIAKQTKYDRIITILESIRQKENFSKEARNAIQFFLKKNDNIENNDINTLYSHYKNLKNAKLQMGNVPFYVNKLVNCIIKIYEQINKNKFAKNNKALNAKDKAKNFCGKLQKGALIGSGGLGAVYELNNDKDYVIKVPHAKNYDELLNANEDAEEEFSKAERLRRIINNYINNYNFAGAQALENAAAPVHIAHEQVDYGKINELIMPKAEGKDGDKLIFGNSKNDKSPTSIYINELGYGDFTITSRRKALSIALQKAMILRALNNGGYANIDTKLKNIMISEDGKVSMIDMGSIVKHGDEIRAYTRYTAAPEVDFGRNANPKSDVFSDAIDRPYILFGSIAEKYIPRFFKKRYGYDEKNIYMKDIVKTYENASYFDVQSKKSEYHRAGFQEPTFPEYFTNSQKMRYMHYHLGFLKVQREVGEIYPIKVLDTFAKLQVFSTEPNPEIRIDEEIVERVLLHLMMSIDHWRNGVYRIEGIETVPGSMTDEILPKNNEQPQLKRATSTERLKRNIAFPGNNENLLRDRSKNERVYYVIPNKLVAKFAN